MSDARRPPSYARTRAIALDPDTPLAVARPLVHHLRWTDLSRLAGMAGANPVLRRLAENRLLLRLESLSAGERTTLARHATARVLRALLGSADAQVARALLGNPRLTEVDATLLVEAPALPRSALEIIAAHPRWVEARSVRLALAGHPRLPVHAALRLLPGLAPADLRALAGDVKVPRIVRLCAERRLSSEGPAGSSRRRSSQPGAPERDGRSEEMRS